jgi:hypothetical protein
MITQTIEDQLKAAMKNRDRIGLDALRYIWALIKEAEIDKKSDLNDEEIQKILKKEVKTREEVVEELDKAGRKDSVIEEKDKLKVLKALLPEQMSNQELEKIISQVISSGETDFGKVMGQVMSRTKGQADGGKVSSLVKARLNQ